MNNETALEEFTRNDIESIFTQSVVFDVDGSYKATLPAHITANFAEVKAALVAGTQKDKAVVVTAETLDAAKARCAYLNKQIDLIETERKEVKKNWNMPYAEFEKKCKELVSILDEAREAQWSQVKTFENDVRNAKRDALLDHFNDIVVVNGRQIVKDLVLPDRLLDEKWLNKGTSLEKAKEELEKKIDKCRDDLLFLKENCGEYAGSAMRHYSYMFDLSAALRSAKQAEEDAKLIKGFDKTSKNPADAVAKEQNEELLTIDFRVTATATQLSDLKAFLKQNGIKYGKVPKE